MRIATIRHALALTILLLALAWSRPARADFTITGTVGEIAAFSTAPNLGTIIRFKLTDATQTAMCADYVNSGVVLKYAWFFASVNQDLLAKEWYAMLLYSKKGAPITCTVSIYNNQPGVCHVTSCILP